MLDGVSVKLDLRYTGVDQAAHQVVFVAVANAYRREEPLNNSPTQIKSQRFTLRPGVQHRPKQRIVFNESVVPLDLFDVSNPPGRTQFNL